MERHSIDWATIHSSDDTLRVQLDGHVPSANWDTAFDKRAAQRGREARAQTWGDVKITDGWITVEDVMVATDGGRLREYLQAIVDATNQAVESVRQIVEARDAEAQQDADNRARRAAELADELRGG